VSLSSITPESPLRLQGVFSLCAAALLLAPLRAENRFEIPRLTLEPGTSGATVPVKCTHDVTVTGYTIAVRYVPSELQVSGATTDGTAAGDPGFFTFQIDPDEGTLVAGVILLSLGQGPDRSLPPGADDVLLLMILDVLAPPGTTSPLLFEDGLGTPFPINNVLTDAEGQTVAPLFLESGAVSIAPVGIEPNAGPDQIRPELARVTLDASESLSLLGRPLSFRWRQESGPAARDPAGTWSTSFTFTVPPLDGADEELVFVLEASDGVGTATDKVTVTGVDLDLRRVPLEAGGLRLSRSVRGDPERKIVFDAIISWGTALEDGIWKEVRFTVDGIGGPALARSEASLYLDANQDGELDPADRKLGGPRDLTDLVFAVSERLANGESLRFLLVVDPVPSGAPAAQLLAPLAWFYFERRRTRRGRRGGGWSRARLLAPILCFFILLGCGSEGPVATSAARFSIEDASALTVEAERTGVRAPITGSLPLVGPPATL
jgi:hypothetical protein